MDGEALQIKARGDRNPKIYIQIIEKMAQSEVPAQLFQNDDVDRI